jgi:hypothetical protein
MTINQRYKKNFSSGWFKESVRHSLARKGVPTGKGSYFTEKSNLQRILSTGNRVQIMGSDERGVILMIKDGVARVLTPDKRVVEVPLEKLEKMDKERIFQQVKEESSHVTLVPAESNVGDDPYGEWRLVAKDGEQVTQIGTGSVIDFKQLFPDHTVKVRGQVSSFQLTPTSTKTRFIDVVRSDGPAPG